MSGPYKKYSILTIENTVHYSLFGIGWGVKRLKALFEEFSVLSYFLSLRSPHSN